MLLFSPVLPWEMPAHSQILPQAPLGFLLYLVSVLYFLSPKLLQSLFLINWHDSFIYLFLSHGLFPLPVLRRW